MLSVVFFLSISSLYGQTDFQIISPSFAAPAQVDLNEKIIRITLLPTDLADINITIQSSEDSIDFTLPEISLDQQNIVSLPSPAEGNWLIEADVLEGARFVLNENAYFFEQGFIASGDASLSTLIGDGRPQFFLGEIDNHPLPIISIAISSELLDFSLSADERAPFIQIVSEVETTMLSNISLGNAQAVTIFFSDDVVYEASELILTVHQVYQTDEDTGLIASFSTYGVDSLGEYFEIFGSFNVIRSTGFIY
jgi:hypothetical protein